ncbi:MAG: type II toxin-antitoxin system HipA family toxin, partial [Ignavibacteriales bacterium]
LSRHRLFPAGEGPGYFGSRRFDRPSPGRRLHMVSLSGAMEARAETPSMSYDGFLRATRAITRHAADVRAAFRRMLFNVLACNRDDHTRQHSFLMDERGEWRLAPAYDLTWSMGPGGEHYMDIEGEGRNPTRAHVDALGKRHGVAGVAAMVEEVAAAVARWPEFAAAAGVTRRSATEIRAAHAQVRERFSAA